MLFARIPFMLLCVAILSVPLQAEDFNKFEVYGGFSYLWNDVNANPGVNSFQQYYFNESNLYFGNIILFLPLYHSLTNPPRFQGLPGFEVSGTYNFNKWLGVEAGFQRHSGQQVLNQTLHYFDYNNTGLFSTTITQTPVDPNHGSPQLPTTNSYSNAANSTTDASGFGTADLSRNTFLVGPKFTLRSRSRFAPFAHIQFGVTQYKRNNFIMRYSINSLGEEYSVDDKGNKNLLEKVTYDLKGKLTDGKISNLGFAMSVGGGIDLNVNKRISIRLIQADYLPTRHRFNYKYRDDSTSDISDYTYTTVQVVQGPADPPGSGNCQNGNSQCYDYTQETQNRVTYTGWRHFSYSVPSQFMNNLKLSAGIVIKF